MNDVKKCKNCSNYYVECMSNKGSGECRAGPPIALFEPDIGVDSLWPGVHAEDWCGSWRSKVAVANKDYEAIAEKDLIESLAEYSHASWSAWMLYLFSKTNRVPCFDGKEAATITANYRERWQRQINTSYADLPEKEKDSDRREALTILSVIKKSDWFKSAINKTLPAKI